MLKIQARVVANFFLLSEHALLVLDSINKTIGQRKKVSYKGDFSQ